LIDEIDSRMTTPSDMSMYIAVDTSEAFPEIPSCEF
jgi:hypothetical protein